jgi:hypothetical protein
MFTEIWFFDLQARLITGLLKSFFDSRLSSHREAAIQTEKLTRMVNIAHRKFPVALILSTPEKKLKKMMGLEKHRLNQQSKVVDRLFAALMVEKMLRDELGGQKITKRKLRGPSLRLVQSVNEVIYANCQKALKEATENATKELLGRFSKTRRPTKISRTKNP